MRSRSREVLARTTLNVYSRARRLRGRAFAWMVGPGFAGFGAGSVLEHPVRIGGAERIAVGSHVFVGSGCWLQTLEEGARRRALRIGDGCELAGNVVLSAAADVELGRSVLIARGTYISDHSHRFTDPGRPVLAQGIDRVAPVRVGDGAWLGANVVVCPGVTIGAGAVIGANSVVTEDIPPHAVAVGAPARVIRGVERSVVTVG